VSTLAFFSNKAGVGQTALVSHLAWMFAERGVPVLAVDLDPQSNLTSMFLTDERVQALWAANQTVFAAVRQTVFASARPLVDRSGDVAPVHVEPVAPNLHLVVGDLSLSRFEDLLAESWSKCLTGEVGAFRVMSAVHRIIAEAADRVGAAIVLIDLGPNLGPLNRAALLAADHIVLPLAPDLFSLQGMESLGPTLREWREGWAKRVGELHDASVEVPRGAVSPIGYVLMSFGVRDSRPVRADDDWIAKIPRTYREVVLDQHGGPVPAAEDDPFLLAGLKHYRSLMPMAMAARKPMFTLKQADGARGAHLDAVRACYDDFFRLAVRVGGLVGVTVV
jgi:chromosome partitioning protein